MAVANTDEATASPSGGSDRGEVSNELHQVRALAAPRCPTATRRSDSRQRAGYRPSRVLKFPWRPRPSRGLAGEHVSPTARLSRVFECRGRSILSSRPAPASGVKRGSAERIACRRYPFTGRAPCGPPGSIDRLSYNTMQTRFLGGIVDKKSENTLRPGRGRGARVCIGEPRGQ
jgi:hypothetical protein